MHRSGIVELMYALEREGSVLDCVREIQCARFISRFHRLMACKYRGFTKFL